MGKAGVLALLDAAQRKNQPVARPDCYFRFTPFCHLDRCRCEPPGHAAVIAMKATDQRPVRPTTRGFTLVEIMIVVVIIGMLAAMAIPGYMRVQRHSQNSRVVNDLRVFSQAFETYATQNAAWPANVGPGMVPPGIDTGDFKVSVWQAPTTIGGEWNWDMNIVPGVTAGISISNFTCDDAQLAEIDAMLDDGNLGTGNFQKVAPNRVTYILE
jgi:type IV pilus assembly protein PilA